MEIENDKEYLFSDVLYNALCPLCKEEITWEADFDADGTTYHSYCDNEHKMLKFSFICTKVITYIETDES